MQPRPNQLQLVQAAKCSKLTCSRRVWRCQLQRQPREIAVDLLILASHLDRATAAGDISNAEVEPAPTSLRPTDKASRQIVVNMGCPAVWHNESHSYKTRLMSPTILPRNVASARVHIWQLTAHTRDALGRVGLQTVFSAAGLTSDRRLQEMSSSWQQLVKTLACSASLLDAAGGGAASCQSRSTAASSLPK